ncbi:MAG: hypothetical protein HOV79_31805 [Hamadaea sp.]|nr:hypothetical protein [Hamadaea sp.]
MVRDRVVLHALAASVSAVVLAPLARPGYVLSYDMNFVPDQQLRLDLIAPVDSLPRAVPLDAAVALADGLVPGWLLQRIVLVAVVWAAVVGAARLTPTTSLGVKVVAGVAYGWTPFLAERLLIGQWGLLIAYAALPWLVRAALRVRAAEPGGLPGLVVAAGLCALTPTGGVIAVAVCAAVLPWRAWARAGPALLILNAPWLVAGYVTTAATGSDPAGATAFAARAENWAGPVVALLGTGGIWNADTTPASRAWALTPLFTAVLLAFGAAGLRPLWRHDLRRLTTVALGGLLLAAASTTAPGAAALGRLVQEVPGAGLLRDAQKFVLPYALLLAVCVALGVGRLAARLPSEPARVLVAGAAVLIVVALPDLAFGGAGALTPVRYPADWAAVARLVGERPEPVLSLPLSQYRRYSWNRDRPVLDPAPRYLPAPVVIDDVLLVGDGTGGTAAIAGEDRRLAAVRARLAAGQPVAGADFGWVLVQHAGDAAAADPRSLAGLSLVHSGPHLSLYRSDAAVSTPDRRRSLPVVLAEIAALSVLLGAAATLVPVARIVRGRRRVRPPIG